MGKNNRKVSKLILVPSPSACTLRSVFLKLFVCLPSSGHCKSPTPLVGGFSPFPIFVPLFLLDVNPSQLQMFYFVLEFSSGVTKY